jgi:hypothetical protein
VARTTHLKANGGDALLDAARNVLQASLTNPAVVTPLRELAAAIDELHSLPYALAGDDESLNWGFTDATDQLGAAWWCILGGAYPTSLLAAHRALQTGLACVAWYEEQTSTLQPRFHEWEAGAPLPSEEALGVWLDQNPAAIGLRNRAGLDISGHVRMVRAGLLDGRRHHHLHNGWSVPGHQDQGLAMACEAIWEVIGTLAAAWVALHPTLARDLSAEAAETVFRHPWPRSVLEAVRAG